MEVRYNKPRVFLSHAKADLDFIEQLSRDLRRCQIDPWLDSEEIRHGKPWLDAIFEQGIPTCDAVLVYFTESSLQSAMVKKEMDAAILQQLKDKRVAFLPYVNHTATRQQLRSDIQALQVPEWSAQNYQGMLPLVVSEIWRGFLERLVTSATQGEQVRRLQAELDLERIQKNSSASVFSPAEDADFGYIWNALNSRVPAEAQGKKQSTVDSKVQEDIVFKADIEFHLGCAIVFLSIDEFAFNRWSLQSLLSTELKKVLAVQNGAQVDGVRYEFNGLPELADQLLTYGLIDRFREPADARMGGIIGSAVSRYRHEWTRKCYRFRYWLAHRGVLPTSIELQIRS